MLPYLLQYLTLFEMIDQHYMLICLWLVFRNSHFLLTVNGVNTYNAAAAAPIFSAEPASCPGV